MLGRQPVDLVLLVAELLQIGLVDVGLLGRVGQVLANPVLVVVEALEVGLDLLEFPTIVFLQSGYNVYSLQQAARRSWRIGQKQPVRVIYLRYANSSQMTCLGLMARKIMVSQSTSGDVPESGLDVLNQDGDSVEVALARQLVTV